MAHRKGRNTFISSALILRRVTCGKLTKIYTLSNNIVASHNHPIGQVVAIFSIDPFPIPIEPSKLNKVHKISETQFSILTATNNCFESNFIWERLLTFLGWPNQTTGCMVSSFTSKKYSLFIQSYWRSFAEIQRKHIATFKNHVRRCLSLLCHFFQG